MMALLLLAGAQPVAAVEPHNCSASGAAFIRQTEALANAVASQAGLSESGRRALIDLRRAQTLSTWCGPVRSESDLARERLLSLLAQDRVDPAALEAARNAEVAAIARDQAAEANRLIETLTALPAADRRKLAAWLADDLRQRWAKQERLRADAK